MARLMAYRLRIVAGPGLGSEVALDEPEITIGRAPENGLVINDNNVSRVHAKLQCGDRIVVIDNGSRNGVYVNDRKVNQQPINPGDRVVIGQTVMELVSDQPRAQQVSGRAPAARPVTSARVGAPPPPNGRGNAVAVVRGQQPATRPNPQQMQRTGAVKAQPRTGPKPQAAGAPKLAMFAVVGVVGVFVIIALAGSGGGGGNRQGTIGGGGTLAKPTLTPPMFPALIGKDGSKAPQDPGAVAKCSKAAQQHMDIGDSTHISNNLTKARESFKKALKVDPSCLSASVRLSVVLNKIDAKIIEYEKSGQQAFDSGDYLRAEAMWKIAIEFIDDPKDPRTSILKSRCEEAKKKVQRQPQ